MYEFEKDFMLIYRKDASARYICDVLHGNGETVFTSGAYDRRRDAASEALSWEQWATDVPNGTGDTIYYILAIPLIWPGPPPGSHRYSGLHFKIGRTRDVLKRLRNLKTGTSEELIIHALQPGNSKAEAALHAKFNSDRRQGEWFAASPLLCSHVLAMWRKYRVLPPEHQYKLLQFAERSEIYAALRKSGPLGDMINPSINEPWHGRVFLDLIHTSLLRHGE